MSEKNNEINNEQKPDENQIEVKRLIDKIRNNKTQADEYLKTIENTRQKTDEHATYAYQAKVNAEEHSKTTAIYKGNAEADQNSIAANKQKSDELLAALTRGKTDVDADAKVISEKRKEVEQATEELVKTVKAGTSHLQDTGNIKNTADACLKTIEQFREMSNQASQETMAAQAKTEQQSSQASDIVIKITDAHEESTGLSSKINEMLTKATADEENLKEIIKKLTKSNETASEYEVRVVKSSEQLEALIKKVESLLPGAASASLASAFEKHKKRFAWPKRLWILVFMGCIGGLVWIAYPSFTAAISDNLSSKTWTDIFRCLIMRLPIVIPLVWLAIYAGRNYMLSIRLEEDYAYKEAISTSFEGYKREMVNIAGEQPSGPNNPITTLCVNVLKAIAERPGRIYEGKQKDITLQNEAREIVEKFAEYSKKQIAEE